MQSAGIALLPARSRQGRATLRALAWSVGLATLSSLFVVAGGVGIRLALAVAILLLLVTITLAKPALGVIATFVYLVLMAFLRRLLIADAGWTSIDPMLLVGPLVAVALLVKLFVLERRQWAPGLLSKLVAVVLLFTIAEVANPASGGIAAGLAGLLFMAVPLLWFFVGREVMDDAALDRLLGMVVVLGTLVACYGLWQTQVGDPPWDVSWLNVTGGYSSLNVGGQIRAFGTFSSSAEYALFVGGALAIAVAFCLRGRIVAALPIPLLAVALFLSSGRSAIVTAALAIVILVGLRTGRPAAALAITLSAIGLAFLALHFAKPALSGEAAGSSALVEHEIGGLTEPLNPESSTLIVHVQLVLEGVKSSVHHPLGQGTAVTNNAAGLNQNSVNSETKATEVDISNAFVALGPAGGALYVIVVLLSLLTVARGCLRGRAALLPAIALLIVALGQWLIGGDYALSSMTWLLVGAAAAQSRGGSPGSCSKDRAPGMSGGAETSGSAGILGVFKS